MYVQKKENISPQSLFCCFKVDYNLYEMKVKLAYLKKSLKKLYSRVIFKKVFISH